MVCVPVFGTGRRIAREVRRHKSAPRLRVEGWEPARLGDANVVARCERLALDREQVGIVREPDPDRFLGVAGRGGSGGGGASVPGAWPTTWR